jgi:hypothetical protein
MLPSCADRTCVTPSATCNTGVHLRRAGEEGLCCAAGHTQRSVMPYGGAKRSPRVREAELDQLVGECSGAAACTLPPSLAYWRTWYCTRSACPHMLTCRSAVVLERGHSGPLWPCSLPMPWMESVSAPNLLRKRIGQEA